MTTFVLVHGAWHGGWCWVRVADRLRAAGHHVFTPTLTGLGERAHLLSPSVDLDTHIRDVTGVLEAEELSDAVLCGHSFAGLVITGAADRAAERLSALVYLDAFIPDDGKCMQDLVPPARRAHAEGLVRDEGEGWRIPPRTAEMFGVETAADRAWVDRRCTPHPWASMVQPVSLSGAWSGVPRKVYIRALGYKASPFGPHGDRAKNDPAWEYVEFDCGHDVMVDRPAELATFLEAMG